MLWGQDLYKDSAGKRPATDYSTAPFAERRKEYLRTLVQMLITDLNYVRRSWDPQTSNSYALKFTDPKREKESLTNIFTGLTQLSGFELSQERMFVALDNADQEDEHSCFSDNTHNDFVADLQGISSVLRQGIIDLVRSKDEFVADEVAASLVDAEAAIAGIPYPFDQAIQKDNPQGRKSVMTAVSSLEALAESMKQAAITLGLDLSGTK